MHGSVEPVSGWARAVRLPVEARGKLPKTGSKISTGRAVINCCNLTCVTTCTRVAVSGPPVPVPECRRLPAL